MSTRFDICTPRPKKDGGSYWVKIGTAWQGEKGIQLVFDALPLPDSEGTCLNRANAMTRRRSSVKAPRSAAWMMTPFHFEPQAGVCHPPFPQRRGPLWPEAPNPTGGKHGT